MCHVPAQNKPGCKWQRSARKDMVFTEAWSTSKSSPSRRVACKIHTEFECLVRESLERYHRPWLHNAGGTKQDILATGSAAGRIIETNRMFLCLVQPHGRGALERTSSRGAVLAALAVRQR